MINIPINKILFLDIETVGLCRNWEGCKENHPNIAEQFVKYIVYKGSIAINGVSLTINEVRGQLIDLCIIPTTLDKTNINQLSVESIVNIEFDILAKYTEQLLLKRNV